MTTQLTPLDSRTARVEALPVPERAKPVKWWAALGIAYMSLAFYTWGRWLTSGQLHATPHGPSPIPSYSLWWIDTIDVISVPLGLVTIYWWGIRPWRRCGRITTDGILIIAFLMCCYQDPLMNYTQLNFDYNSYHLNVAGWLGSIPGVLQPGGHNYIEPLVGWMPAYLWALFLPAVLGCVILRAIRRRWPRIGNVGLFSLIFGFFCLFDLVIEPTLFVRTEVWAYPGVIRGLSLWAGTKYEFPIYESICMGLLYTGATALRWFLDDKGHTVAERGVDELRVRSGTKTILRTFAVTGAAAAIFFFTYNLPFNLISTHDAPFPKDMPSYLLDDICGTGTPYQCPGPGVAIYHQAPRASPVQSTK
jgi:hypothetical protein